MPTGSDRAGGTARLLYHPPQRAAVFRLYRQQSAAEPANLHGLEDFFTAVKRNACRQEAGCSSSRADYQNILGLRPADPDPAVQKNFSVTTIIRRYSDAQISEAMVAKAVNAIARSRYWPQSAIIITWDDSEGDYDHVPPPIRSRGPDKSVISDGPRVPLLVISPYARVHYIAHESGDHGSVVKFADTCSGSSRWPNCPTREGPRAGQAGVRPERVGAGRRPDPGRERSDPRLTRPGSRRRGRSSRQLCDHPGFDCQDTPADKAATV